MKFPDFKFQGLSNGKGIKAPKFLTDLYADLRDRRLIPLVILLVVAIVAAPFLLGSDHESEETPDVAAIPAVATGSSAESAFSVVPAERKLRAYGKRLGYRTARDPFGSPAGAAPGGGAHKASQGESDGTKAGGGGEVSQTTSTAEVETVPSGGGAVAESETGTATTKPRPVKATIKAQVGVAAVVDAGYTDSKPKALELEAQDKLPPAKPAIVYTGTSKKGGVLFLMTSQVTEFTGDGHCVIGGALCQVVELKRKGSETFRIGYGQTRYKVRLRGFAPIIKEEVVEAEGKKLRVPNKKHRGGSTGASQGEASVGSEPSPRWLVR